MNGMISITNDYKIIWGMPKILDVSMGRRIHLKVSFT